MVKDGKVMDVQMVYDGTKLGLNDALWAPNLGLTSIETVLQGTNVGT